MEIRLELLQSDLVKHKRIHAEAGEQNDALVTKVACVIILFFFTAQTCYDLKNNVCPQVDPQPLVYKSVIRTNCLKKQS